MYFVQLFDWYVASISVLLICTIEIVIIGWIYGIENFIRDIEFMISNKIHIIWRLCWKYITPSILFFILYINLSRIFNPGLSYNGVLFPQWALYLGWLYGFISVSVIPIYMVYLVSKSKGSLWERFIYTLKPYKWEPALKSDKILWQNYCNQMTWLFCYCKILLK